MRAWRTNVRLRMADVDFLFKLAISLFSLLSELFERHFMSLPGVTLFSSCWYQLMPPSYTMSFLVFFSSCSSLRIIPYSALDCQFLFLVFLLLLPFQARISFFSRKGQAYTMWFGNQGDTEGAFRNKRPFLFSFLCSLFLSLSLFGSCLDTGTWDDQREDLEYVEE